MMPTPTKRAAPSTNPTWSRTTRRACQSRSAKSSNASTCSAIPSPTRARSLRRCRALTASSSTSSTSTSWRRLWPPSTSMKCRLTTARERTSPSAARLPVNWQFADIEYGGWARRDQFVKALDPVNRFLIVTEGSSDAGIIRHALKLLKPHLGEFFDFVDMNEGYPFTGTGNLFNFTKGLISIAVQNKVIILYDNDAEGVASYNLTSRLNLPWNMRVLKLPDLPEFASYSTVGPSGEHRADINSRGAAIACYLDAGPSPVVRWNNFNKELGVYQGELIGKGDVMRRFYKLD